MMTDFVVLVKEERWMPILDEQKNAYKKVKEENHKMKENLEDFLSNWMDTEKKNKQLIKDLADFEHRVGDLSAELAETKRWNTEYKDIAKKSEVMMSGYETHLGKQVAEMNETIKGYHDLMPENDPEWWKMEGLRKRVEGLERHVKGLGDRLETVKEERQIAYREIETMMDERKKLLDENEVLRFEVESQSAGSDRRESIGTRYIPFQPRTEAEVRGLLYMTPAQLEDRRAEIARFKQKQLRAQQIQSNEFKVMERVRAWALGHHYPSKKKAWKATVKKTAWERWDGKTWAETVANEEDLELLKNTNIRWKRLTLE